MTDTLEVEREPVTLLGRSELERVAVCPRQARFIETGAVSDISAPALSGDAVHHAVSKTVSEFVQSRGAMNQVELVDSLADQVAQSRPDIQPDAIRGLRPAQWSIARFLSGIHPGNILRFDGGRGDQSGQLSHDFAAGIRLTCEVDFLYAGPSPEVIHLVDWKSGHKQWTFGDVADSFQFQFYGLVVLENYPDVKAVEIRVWNTRLNQQTYAVLIRREQLRAIEWRINEAVRHWLSNRDKSPPAAEAWPELRKCRQCPAARLCSVSPVPEIDPVAVLDALVVAQARVDAWTELLAAVVEKTGQDVTSPAGNCFGTGKPKKERKPVKALYSKEIADDGEGT